MIRVVSSWIDERLQRTTGYAYMYAGEKTGECRRGHWLVLRAERVVLRFLCLPLRMLVRCLARGKVGRGFAATAVDVLPVLVERDKVGAAHVNCLRAQH